MATTQQYVEGQDLHKQQVKAFLDQRAQEDAVFGIKYQTTTKTMDGCMRHLYKEGLKYIVMKAAKINGKTCDVADVPNEIAHQQAIDYFMNDELNEEQIAQPSAPKPQQTIAPKSIADELSSIGAHEEKPKNNEKAAKKAQEKIKKAVKEFKPKAAAPKIEKKPLPEEENIFDSLFD